METDVIGMDALTSTLDLFYAEGWITDVVKLLKSGKEATAYCCRADPATGQDYFVAKVYRDQQSRSFKNDAIYREGRPVLDGDGRPSARLSRGLRRKGKIGRAIQFRTWIDYEYDTLRLLHAAGADVPRPIGRSERAILMEYLGDGDGPAPQLQSVNLEPTAAPGLFHLLMRNVELWLAHDRIHGDLSAYNVLYWNGAVKVIDFPQAIDPRFNSNAPMLLARDVENLCRYFNRYGIDADAARLSDRIWARFLRAEL